MDRAILKSGWVALSYLCSRLITAKVENSEIGFGYLLP
jgi:hypothetical protein